MTLKDKINEDLKTALKSGDKIRVNTIRSVRALILEFEKSGSGKVLDEQEEIKLLSGAAKKRKESIEQFRNAGRNDLAEKEEAELKILMDYLPKQLDEIQIRQEVAKIAGEINAGSKEDFPRLMPEVMKSLKGKADGNVIRREVEKFLGIQ
ncbi:MAG: GatB/YqeY domain-containing protein [Ignavibacteriaceae bacterium]